MLVLISGVSGVGKTTIIRKLLQKHNNYAYWPSYTTRAMRKGEVQGNPYMFVTKEEFLQEKSKGNFFETCEVHQGIFYGTHKGIYAKYASIYDVLMTDIDVVGMQALKKQIPDCVTIFVTLESLQDLRLRLQKRGETQIEKRLSRAAFEQSHMHLYDYVVKNEQLAVACKEIEEIIEKELQRRKK